MDGYVKHYDSVAATVQPPIFARLIPSAESEYLDYQTKPDYLSKRSKIESTK
jgi:hypothetical protein